MGMAIIGAGNVGMALGQAFTRQGEHVVFGVPEPQKYAAAVAALGENARLASTAAIAQSVPDWQGRVLVDATNPLAPGLAGLTMGTNTSAAEELARLARGARVVKAFNSTGAENMADAAYPGGVPMMPVCGDDADARQRVMALATLIGFEAVDMGPLMAARYLEPFAMTWIHLAFRQGFGRRFAFGLLRRG